MNNLHSYHHGDSQQPEAAEDNPSCWDDVVVGGVIGGNGKKRLVGLLEESSFSEDKDIIENKPDKTRRYKSYRKLKFSFEEEEGEGAKDYSSTVVDDEDYHEEMHSHTTGQQRHHQQQQSALSGSGAGAYDYWQVIMKYPMFRAYLISHFCQNLGDWFVQIASILIVQEFSATGKTIAHLSISILLPKAIFTHIGGMIADRYDRRICMIVIDSLSGIIVLGYLVAVAYQSLMLIYAITILRSTVWAIYYPISTGIVPLLVPDNAHDLQLAVTINTFEWSITSMIGGLVAGAITSHVGLATCYWIDCATFFISAAAMYWGVSGDFTVHDNATSSSNSGNNKTSESSQSDICCGDLLPTPPQSTTTILTSIMMMMDTPMAELVQYLWACGFGLLVFQKGTASFIWGPENIVNAKFATIFNEDGSENESLSSWYTGILFSITGAGFLAGSALAPWIANTNAQYPHTLQRACVIAYMLSTCGWILISTATTFPIFLVFTFLKAMGSSIAWVNSTLVLQTLSEPNMLGRVLAVECSLLVLAEAASASMAGRLYDAGWNKNQIALFGALLGGIMVLWWGIYYWVLKGAAASPRYVRIPAKAGTKEEEVAVAAGTRSGEELLDVPQII